MRVEVSNQSGGGQSAVTGTTPPNPSSGTPIEFIGTTTTTYQPLAGPDATGPNVTVAASVLPTGASTSANQQTEITALQAIQSNTNGVATAANQTSEITQLTGINGKLTTTANGLKVDGSGVTQPVSGTVTANQGTAGATAWKVDGSGVTQPVSGTVAVSSLPSIPAGSNAIGSVSVSNFPASQTVSVSNFPTTQGVNLSQVGGTAVTLGQKGQAASIPVTLASDQPNINVTSQGYAASLGTGSPAAVNADLIPSANVAAYGAVLLTISGTWSGTVSFQGSNDATNYYAIQALSTATATAAAVTSTTTVGQWLIPLQAAYIRVRCTAYTSGTITGAAYAVSEAPQDQGARNTIVQSGTITTVGSATVTPTKGTITDGSGTTSATVSTATTALAVNASRKYLFIQNVSSSATIWFNFTTTAVAGQPSMPLPPLAAYVQEAGFISTEAISVISTTASVPYVIKQA